jgi:uncharacterized protein DUF2742
MHYRTKTGPPGPRDGESRDGHPALAQQLSDHDIRSQAQLITASRQVAWGPVHEYINRQRRRLAARELSAPLLGTPAWLSLPDEHPAKLSAVLNLAEAAAYSISADQVAQAAASQSISSAADWTAIANAVRQRAEFAAANPWARRVAS